MTTSKAFGWVVEVTPPAPNPILRFNVAEPDKTQAVDAVRRRVREASGANVAAIAALSSHAVYGVLRMKRGDVSRVD
ncbi:MAG TPA: hypothetical protein VIG38_11065 [Hyphomicrobium sp.]|jgi:hypothetical protein